MKLLEGKGEMLQDTDLGKVKPWKHGKQRVKRQMRLHQTLNFLHSKENSQWVEEKTYRMG